MITTFLKTCVTQPGSSYNIFVKENVSVRKTCREGNRKKKTKKDIAATATEKQRRRKEIINRLKKKDLINPYRFKHHAGLHGVFLSAGNGILEIFFENSVKISDPNQLNLDI